MDLLVLKVFCQAQKAFRTVRRENNREDDTQSLHSQGPEVEAVHLPCLLNTRTGNLSSHTGPHHKWVMI